MNFEFNPFRLLIPPGGEPIRSITIQSNLDWFNIPSPVTGQEAFLPISAKTDIAALKVFGTGVAIGTPSMRSLTAAHIPNIEISQVNGLQAALNSLVKSIASGNPTALSITHNSTGDYLITPNFGTTANTIAQGNDSRFSSIVTGIRKGAGGGALDTAAIAQSDYWDRTVFLPSGASIVFPAIDRRGLVPDPGPSSGGTRYLCEDGVWKVPTAGIPGTGTVTSVALSMPSIFAVTGSPITVSGTLAVTYVLQPQGTFFAAPPSALGAPTFRGITFLDINPIVGTSSGTIAAGNDTRFPASVVGIRKSTGAGSTDVAAVKWTDYWDNKVFVSKGPSSSIGLVPNPGPGAAPYTRFLRDDSTWQTVTVDTASITNAQLATMPAGTIKANATAGVASPTNVIAKDARSSLLLNLESITLAGDAPFNMSLTDKFVATNATFTTSHSWTLPLAGNCNPGQTITVSDNFGGLSGNLVLNIARIGSDVIEGSSNPVVLDTKFANATFISNGNNKWFLINRSPSITKRIFTTGAGSPYITPTGAKALYVEVLGGGGGGGGASAGLGEAAGGGGGAGGGFSAAYITDLQVSYNYVVGSGGSAGNALGTVAGGAGGSSSFGTVVIATGGGGGSGDPSGGTTPALPRAGGSAGIGSAGDIKTNGTDGSPSARYSGTQIRGGTGGGSFYSGSNHGGGSGGDPGTSGTYGSGGGGGTSVNAGGNSLGGAGAQGLIVLTEYY